MDDSLKHLEEYFEKREKELEERKLVEEEKRREAIRFIKEHAFILGKANDNAEFEEITRYADKLLDLQKKYGCQFHAFVYNGLVIAIPNRNFGVSFSLDVSEVLSCAKRMGESLADYFDV